MNISEFLKIILYLITLHFIIHYFSFQAATQINHDMGGETNESTPAAFTPIEITNVDDDEDDLMDEDQVTS